MANKAPAFCTLLLTLSTLAACGPCVDSGRTPVPGPGGGSVIVAADMCDGDDDSSASDGSSDGTGSTSGTPTDTTEDDGSASDTSASSGGEDCPNIACDQNGVCPGGTFCQAGECVMTCPCQADPGPCASKPFGGPVWFCPPDAAPMCG